MILFAFYVGDWILLELLPRTGTSFGPAKPPVFMLAILRVPLALLPTPWWIVAEGVGTLLVIYAFWIEPHRLSVTYQSLKSSKLGFETPLRVLHLGDIHVERLTRRERALPLIKSLHPDVILFSGDFLNLSYTARLPGSGTRASGLGGIGSAARGVCCEWEPGGGSPGSSRRIVGWDGQYPLAAGRGRGHRARRQTG